MIPFMEFMEREGATVILQFWIAVENLEQQVRPHRAPVIIRFFNVQMEAGSQAEMQADAMQIYNRFFPAQVLLFLDPNCCHRVSIPATSSFSGFILPLIHTE